MFQKQQIFFRYVLNIFLNHYPVIMIPLTYCKIDYFLHSHILSDFRLDSFEIFEKLLIIVILFYLSM